MRYVEFPSAELKVSRISFGAIPIRARTNEGAREVIHEALDSGINFFDTARGYDDSESKLGYALRQRRNEVILASKTAKRSREEAWDELKTSLSQMKTDYIDLYQLHNVRTDEAYEEVMGSGGALQALKEAREQGLIRYIGITSHDEEISIRAIRSGEFVSIMVPLNFMEDDFADEVLPAARQHDIAVINMKPFAGGMIEHAALALPYVLSFDAITVTIPGMRTQKEVRENVQFASHCGNLPSKKVRKLQQLKEEIGSEFCRSCDYCQPCPNEVEISRVLRAMRGVRRLGASWLEDNLDRIEKNVDACDECETCLPRCPYDLDIPLLLREQVRALRQHAGEQK